jgi:hypothetical protein
MPVTAAKASASHLSMFDAITRGADAAVAADPRPLQAACTIKETVDHRISNWIDILIKGPTRAAVEQARDKYQIDHAACEPAPAFYFIQGNDRDGFRVGGSRGRDPRK